MSSAFSKNPKTDFVNYEDYVDNYYVFYSVLNNVSHTYVNMAYVTFP